jgi:anhydro-N-acetylmuramic acid kinase
MPFDRDGAIAAQHPVDQQLLEIMSDDPYFRLPLPKSTGRDYFNEQWLEAKLAACGREISKQVVLSTLTQLTAQTAVNALHEHDNQVNAVYVFGGGALNVELMKRISSALNCVCKGSSALGIPEREMEALAFAWFAYQHVNGVPLSLNTGSSRKHILGDWTPWN